MFIKGNQIKCIHLIFYLEKYFDAPNIFEEYVNTNLITNHTSSLILMFAEYPICCRVWSVFPPTIAPNAINMSLKLWILSNIQQCCSSTAKMVGGTSWRKRGKKSTCGTSLSSSRCPDTDNNMEKSDRFVTNL